MKFISWNVNGLWTIIIALSFLCVSCGREKGDDTVKVSLSLINTSSEFIYVETNFPTSLDPGSQPVSSLINYKNSIYSGSNTIDLFRDAEHFKRIRSYDDFVNQLITYFPDATICIYGTNEDLTRSNELVSYPVRLFPAIYGSDSYDSPGKFYFKPLTSNDYPLWITFEYFWDGSILINSINLNHENKE